MNSITLKSGLIAAGKSLLVGTLIYLAPKLIVSTPDSATGFANVIVASYWINGTMLVCFCLIYLLPVCWLSNTQSSLRRCNVVSVIGGLFGAVCFFCLGYRILSGSVSEVIESCAALLSMIFTGWGVGYFAIRRRATIAENRASDKEAS